MSTVPKAVNSAVPPAVKPTDVKVDQESQYGPYQAAKGKSVAPSVGKTEVPDADEMAHQPGFAGEGSIGSEKAQGSKGAPTVPDTLVAGMFYKPGPIAAITSMDETVDPYKKVNNPPTRGRYSWVKSFANHVFNGKQNVNEAGWQQNSAQQRTSYMRMTMPPKGNGYDPETSSPKQLPQAVQTQKFLPTTGTDAPGVRVLNSQTLGAGQVAGGEGGSNYTPEPGAPTTNSVDGSQANSAQPMWG